MIPGEWWASTYCAAGCKNRPFCQHHCTVCDHLGLHLLVTTEIFFNFPPVVTISDNKILFFVKLCFSKVFPYCIQQNKQNLLHPLSVQSLWKQTLYPGTRFIWTSRLSRPSVRAKAAIREMNKLAESFFFLLSAENTASHSIRMKLAILAIPTDLLATQQLPQWFSGDVHKNEMAFLQSHNPPPTYKRGCRATVAAKSWLNWRWAHPTICANFPDWQQ